MGITTSLEEAIAYLRQGDIVAVPTETVYGLAGNADNEIAIKKIYSLKNRPLNHPLIMHVGKDWDLERWVNHIPDYAQQLINKFWPGPLTLVFNTRSNAVSTLITGGTSTIAIRCPSHPLTQSLLQTLNFPLVAPSANPFSKVSPTTAEHVYDSFQDKSLLILDGGRCSVGIESTIIDATEPLNFQILRHGIINQESIFNLLGQGELINNNDIPVPGKLETHYQPEKPLYAFENKVTMREFCLKNPKAYLLSFTKNTEFPQYSGYQLPENPIQFAYELYFQLRIADQSAAPLIVIELPPPQEHWLGSREKIIKASIKIDWILL